MKVLVVLLSIFIIIQTELKTGAEVDKIAFYLINEASLALSGKSVMSISDYLMDNFHYKLCKGEYNKDEFIDILFGSFALESVKFELPKGNAKLDDNILIFELAISGLGKDFKAQFLALEDRRLPGDFVLFYGQMQCDNQTYPH